MFVGSGVGALVVSGLLLRHGDRVSGAATVNGPLVVAEPLKDMWSSLERATCDMLQPRVQVRRGGEEGKNIIFTLSWMCCSVCCSGVLQ